MSTLPTEQEFLQFLASQGGVHLARRHLQPPASIETHEGIKCFVVGGTRYPLAKMDAVDFAKAQAHIFKHRHRALASAVAADETITMDLKAKIIAESVAVTVPMSEMFKDYSAKLYFIWLAIAKNTSGISLEAVEGWNIPLDVMEEAFDASLPSAPEPQKSTAKPEPEKT